MTRELSTSRNQTALNPNTDLNLNKTSDILKFKTRKDTIKSNKPRNSSLSSYFDEKQEPSLANTNRRQSTAAQSSNYALINTFRSLIGYIFQSQFLTLTFFIIISILTNSLYFNFYYLPSLSHNLNQQYQSASRIADSSTKTAKDRASTAQSPSLPYLEWSTYSKQNKLIKSFEHVVFPTLDDHKSRHDLIEDNQDKSTNGVELNPVGFNFESGERKNEVKKGKFRIFFEIF